MNGNKLKLNLNVNNCDNNANNELKIRFRNENDLISRNHNRKQLPLGGRRTPSPPKTQVSSNQYLQQLNLSSVKPMIKIQSSLTKSCYTGWHSSQRPAQRLPTADPFNSQKTPECERKLKKLEQSGLMAKFANFHITKSVPLALEEEEEEEEDNNNCDQNLNDEVFIDISKTNETIELKSSEEFEPNFVSQIKDEVRKISSNSFTSQSSQKSSNKSGLTNDSTKRKRSSNGSRSQNNTAVFSKWQKKLTQISNKPSNGQQLSSRKSKSNDNLVKNNNKEKPKEVEIRIKSDNNLDKKPKERRSQSSEGRLSTSQPKDNKLNKRKSDSLSRRSRTQSNAEQKSKNNDSKSSSNSSLTDNSNSIREKTIRKIKVNNKYYQILNCIGQGGSSRVYQVYDPELQMTLAIKVVDLSRADSLTVCGYKNEITLLSKLRECKRVVRMYDYEYQNNGQQLLVVMEKGDSDLSNVLNSFIESEGKRSLDSHLIRFYWQQMLKAVDEIHSYGVVHSDLKPVNFILVAGKLKLIDFGIANAIQANGTSVYKESQIGTINYMAPEALQNMSQVKGKTVIKYNCKADIWSLGCILYNLVYGKTPFHHFENLFQKANAILDPNHQIKYPPIDDLSLFDVMKKCLQRDPNKRPTTTELLNHRYLIDSKPTKANDYQNELISQINNLTPNRIKQLSQVLEKLSKK